MSVPVLGSDSGGINTEVGTLFEDLRVDGKEILVPLKFYKKTLSIICLVSVGGFHRKGGQVYKAVGFSTQFWGW